MNKIKIAVLGCGSIAEIAHFPSIKKRNDAVLVAVCDLDPKRAEETAKKWGAEQWFTDYREMFSKVKMDAVIIATPNNVHRNQVIAAARSKVDILVEKPIAV
ncbi:MAG: Gfo/Idh/MocA family oxidoreductase, partial [Eubacteriales bacterium]|nr:Gfo/Idh/MocA family oxidoreductase [Eubacteriales bacterium]